MIARLLVLAAAVVVVVVGADRVVCGVAVAAEPSGLPPRPPPPRFIIGVWCAPMGDMGAWRARSVNTLVGYERGPGGRPATLDEWIATARRHELFTIRHPHEDLAVDAVDPYLLALMHT